jgi:putative colanic acid biosynthesis UDP-glucose lipid carrier transferase
VNRWNLFSLFRRVADALAVMFSFGAAYLLYFNSSRTVPYSLVQFLSLGSIAVVIFLITLQAARLYERQTSLLQVVETRRLLLAWVFGSLLLFSFTFYVRLLDLSRLMITSALGIAFFALLIERAIVFQVGIKMLIFGKPYRRALIYGAGVVGRHIYKRIFHSPALGVRVVGFLDDDTTLWGKLVSVREVSNSVASTVFGGLDKVERLVKEEGVTDIFIAMPSASYQRNLEIAELGRKLKMQISVVPPTYGHLMHNLEVREFGGIPVIQEKERSPQYIYPVFKRLFDVVVSAFSLIVLSPLIAILAIFIRLDSPGPIIFRQRRVGLNGKEFDFYKFRSMHVTSSAYALTPKSAEDPRITRFGRWLRRSSLDELPQFLNVLRGNMSIVGPRPEMPFIVATYNEEQRERLRVKPGITGVWQISAVRGEPIHANMEYDLFYIEHRSLLLDLIIMCKTIATAIRGIGAY